MPTRLVSLDGNADIPIDSLLVVIGRHCGCDARIDSARISRRHCCLALDREGILVRDLGSTNGTRINGRRVETGLLLPGDELTIAHFRYRLETRLGDGPAPLPVGSRSPGPDVPRRPDPVLPSPRPELGTTLDREVSTPDAAGRRP